MHTDPRLTERDNEHTGPNDAPTQEFPLMSRRFVTPFRIGITTIVLFFVALIGVFGYSTYKVKTDPALHTAVVLPTATDATTATAASVPTTPTAPVASAATTTTKPLPPLTTVVPWHRHCPQGAGFCATFPYIQQTDFSRETFEAATAKSGSRPVSYGSDVYGTTYPADDKHGCATPLSRRCQNGEYYCANQNDKRCWNGPAAVRRWHYVEIIDSRFSRPCDALRALNSGDVSHATCTKVNGYYTVRFADTSNPFMAVYAHNQVYLVAIGSTNGTASPLAQQFFNSFTIVQN